MSIDPGQLRTAIRAMLMEKVTACGDAIVADLKDEVADPKSSRPTINNWPLRKDTGAGQASIADHITETADGITLNIGGAALKWYMAWHELVGRILKSGEHRVYAWFWPTIRHNIGKYLGILNAKGLAGVDLGTKAGTGGAGAARIAEHPAARSARRAWRVSTGRKWKRA